MALLQSLAASLGGRWWRWVMAPTPADSRRVPLLLQRLASTRLRPVTIAALWLALVGALAALARASHVAGAPSKRWKQLHEDLRAAAADDETPEEKHVRPQTPFCHPSCGCRGSAAALGRRGAEWRAWGAGAGAGGGLPAAGAAARRVRPLPEARGRRSTPAPSPPPLPAGAAAAGQGGERRGGAGGGLAGVRGGVFPQGEGRGGAASAAREGAPVQSAVCPAGAGAGA